MTEPIIVPKLKLTGEAEKVDPARFTVTAVRRPPPGPGLQGPGDVVVDCGMTSKSGKPCGWHAYGPRSDMKKAVEAHNRMFHQDQNELIITRLNWSGQ